MTNTTATPVRVLLDDAISEYISDTGDAPHYRVHLLDLLESTLQADQQDTDLVRTPGTVEISREALAHLLTIYELAQASLFVDGEIAPGGEFYDRLVDAVDDERNVEWGIEIRAAITQEEPA